MIRVKSAFAIGIHAFPIDIEVDISNGLPQLSIVGLPDTSIKEARERVRTAIKNSGFSFPSDRVTVNLAPADLKKEGAIFDLPIALGILACQGAVPAEKLAGLTFLGELALDGTIRPLKGTIAITAGLKDAAFVVPDGNAEEAALAHRATIYSVKSLRETTDLLLGNRSLTPVPKRSYETKGTSPSGADFSEVRGQQAAKRALEIAVAGDHKILMIGPPGSGKTMLARRIPNILPPMDFEEALEITKIQSVAGFAANRSGLAQERPFRAPHYTSSAIALTGGGTDPKPGEMSLAHGGVLFLDEFPEFRRDALETLRGPLEDGCITISRAKSQVTYPSDFLLAAAMNPCPCGHLGDSQKTCRCALGQIRKYQSKVSGPILDRIDIHIEVPALSFRTLTSQEPAESSATIRERICACRKIQKTRYRLRPHKTNSRMNPRDVKEFATPDPQGRKLIEMAMKELHLSARAYYKVLKIARTISDLAGCEQIQSEHIAEAIQYRSLDRQWWS
ncbi:MAG: YifB family Mg chelatase-like AAA ATPase [Candidatus Omnitrophica bacterium]|nr:YifB family Mg chelatase-like AAA ATPase [Candidatus Omnitrophota bacterium]